MCVGKDSGVGVIFGSICWFTMIQRMIADSVVNYSDMHQTDEDMKIYTVWKNHTNAVVAQAHLGD